MWIFRKLVGVGLGARKSPASAVDMTVGTEPSQGIALDQGNEGGIAHASTADLT
jgi:hypothetical protein